MPAPEKMYNIFKESDGITAPLNKEKKVWLKDRLKNSERELLL